MTRLRLLTLQLALAGVLSSSVCAAQTDEEKTAARAAGKAAQQAFVEGDYERSIALFHKAESLVHAPTHLLFIARAHEKQGRLVLALEAYNKIVYEQLPENAPPAFVEAQVAAKQEADALEQRIPTLTLTLEGAEVTDFRLLVGKQERPGLAGVPQPVDPGSHSIQAVAP